jgi:hypothetical protein
MTAHYGCPTRPSATTGRKPARSTPPGSPSSSAPTGRSATPPGPGTTCHGPPRALPNGYCQLPLVKTCPHANAPPARCSSRPRSSCPSIALSSRRRCRSSPPQRQRPGPQTAHSPQPEPGQRHPGRPAGNQRLPARQAHRRASAHLTSTNRSIDTEGARPGAVGGDARTGRTGTRRLRTPRQQPDTTAETRHQHNQ